MRFGFGQNWASFVHESFSEERVAIAQQHLLRFLKLPDLRGKTFLDIGCGSGIHSLGAWRAGAATITGFDYDLDSVRTTERLRSMANDPPNWTVRQGSVLDRNLIDGLERADIVYSWGVLHHTGEMWRAIENAASTLKPDGVFYIALYTSDVYVDPSPAYWIDLKQRYNRAGSLQRRLMEWAYAWRFTIRPELKAGRNPLNVIRNYGESRGMAYWSDVRDWLGGWPMEFAGIAETIRFCRDRLGLELLHIWAGEGNTEYLFAKTGARTYFHDLIAAIPAETLPQPFARGSGHLWKVEIPQHAALADTVAEPKRSTIMLYENGVPLGFAHAPHAHIEQLGGGRYSHWGDQLLFSTTDHSDPTTNGRAYTLRVGAL